MTTEGTSSPRRERLRIMFADHPNRWQWAVSLLLLAVAGVMIAPHFYAQDWLGRPLRSQLGFDTASPWYRIEGDLTEVIEIEVVPGGVFDRAGVPDGAIPVDYMSRGGFSGFYRDLHAARGKALALRVVPGGGGQALSKRPARMVSIPVPR